MTKRKLKSRISNIINRKDGLRQGYVASNNPAKARETANILAAEISVLMAVHDALNGADYLINTY